MMLNIRDMVSTKFDKVKLITSDVFAIYLYEDEDSVYATIFLDRLKIEKFDYKKAVIDIKMKVAKGEGYNSIKKL